MTRPASFGERHTAASVHTFRCYPPEDTEFATFVASCDQAMPPSHRENAPALEQLLRMEFPSATILVTDPVGPAAGQSLWHVFRDGTVDPGWLAQMG